MTEGMDTTARDPLAELRFLREILRLATTAGTWEELLESVVDGTRDALDASVSSLYLLDRDGADLTLAATNGLDRYQIGRAKVPFGEGITGSVAASREPMVIPSVRDEPRFLWVRGIDQRRFVASMLSVPLTWHDQVVGVLNVQTEQPREFTESDVAQLSAVADLLAGIVEKGRLQREAEAQVEQLKALDHARNELIALVTHELRTPLAVVRAYTDLLSEEPPLDGRSSRDPDRRATRAAWHTGTLDQIDRLNRLVDSILESVRVVPDSPADLRTIDLRATIEELVEELRPLLHRHRTVLEPSPRLHAVADRGRLRQGAGAPGRERGQVRAARHAGRDRVGARRRDRPDRDHRRGPGDPRGVARADLRALCPARDADGARVGDRALRRPAARRVHGGPAVVRARARRRGEVRARAAGRGGRLMSGSRRDPARGPRHLGPALGPRHAGPAQGPRPGRSHSA